MPAADALRAIRDHCREPISMRGERSNIFCRLCPIIRRGQETAPSDGATHCPPRPLWSIWPPQTPTTTPLKAAWPRSAVLGWGVSSSPRLRVPWLRGKGCKYSPFPLRAELRRFFHISAAVLAPHQPFSVWLRSYGTPSFSRPSPSAAKAAVVVGARGRPRLCALLPRALRCGARSARR